MSLWPFLINIIIEIPARAISHEKNPMVFTKKVLEAMNECGKIAG